MQLMRSFSPAANSTVNINVAAASANVFVQRRNGPITVRIVNDGVATVWINWGGSTVTADTTNDLPVGPGVHEVLTFSPAENGDLYIAAIAAGATGRVYFTPGEGL